jgi:hypothetical protein
VTRDRIMTDLDERYPQYGFARHKGYCTPDHGEALMDHGPCPSHRHSYANVIEAVRARGGSAPVPGPRLDPAGDAVLGPAGDAALGPAGDAASGPAGDAALGPAGDAALGPAGDAAQSPAMDLALAPAGDTEAELAVPAIDLANSTDIPGEVKRRSRPGLTAGACPP